MAKIAYNRLFLNIIASFSLLLAVTHAGIIPLDNFNLLPYQFTYNFPYVYSDRKPEDVAENTPLQNAYVKVDMKIKMMGKNVTDE